MPDPTRRDFLKTSALVGGGLLAAESLALALSNDFERGAALAHLIGWLDGDRDYNFHLMTEARTACEKALAAHPGAA